MSDLFNQWHEFQLTDEAGYEAEVAKALQDDALWARIQALTASEDGGPFIAKEDIAKGRYHTFFRYFHEELVATKDKWTYETDEYYGSFNDSFMELCDRLETDKAAILEEMTTPVPALIPSENRDKAEEAARPAAKATDEPFGEAAPESVLHKLCAAAIHPSQFDREFKHDAKDPLVLEAYKDSFHRVRQVIVTDALATATQRAATLEKTRVELDRVASLKRRLAERRARIDAQPREILAMMNNPEVQYAVINGYEALNTEIYENRRVTEPLHNIWEDVVGFHNLRTTTLRDEEATGSPVTRPSLRVSVESQSKRSEPDELGRGDERTIEIAQRIQCLTPNRVNLGDVRNIILHKHHHAVIEDDSSSSVNLEDLRI